jgi:serine/threonine protein kinase
MSDTDPIDGLLRAVGRAPPVNPIAGRMLGAYRVGERLGAGGMGEVYAAEDTRLGRTVALKLLPPSLADDPSRRARFEREARTLASLNHPGIVTIFAVEEVDGRTLLVMERISGKPLGDLISHKGFSSSELLRHACGIAEAIAAAHLAGIVHRDLKPGNIMLTDDGRIKVLDFGLAKLDAPVGEDDPTATATVEGRVLGTTAYMSPEQAQGRRSDSRSDVFSLGIVLFEMASGRRPFGGSSQAELLSSILRDPAPSLEAVKAAVPAGFARVVARCLEKEPTRRYQSAVDLRNDLEELAGTGRPGARRVRPALVLAGLFAGLALGIGAAAWRWPRPPSVLRINHLAPLTDSVNVDIRSPSLSPDGSWVVYAARRRGGSDWDLFRLRVGGENAMDLTTDFSGDDTTPVISPDGERIAFHSERQGGGLFVMGATGESVRRVTREGFDPVWSPDGRELYAASEAVDDPYSRRGLSEVWAWDVVTGRGRRVARNDAIGPAVSPHGKRVAFWGVVGSRRVIYTVRASASLPEMDGGTPINSADERVPVLDDAAAQWAPVWSPDGGTLLFASDRGGSVNLWSLAVDEESGRALGPPEPLSLGARVWMGSPSLSRDGLRMALTVGGPEEYVERVPIDHARGVVTGPPERLARGSWEDARGERIVFETQRPEQVMVLDVATGARQRLTESGRNRSPRFFDGGHRVIFSSNRSGEWALWAINVDGSGLQQISEGPYHTDPIVAPDDRTVLFECTQSSRWCLLDAVTRKPLAIDSRSQETGVSLAFHSQFWPDSRSILGNGIGPAEGSWRVDLENGSTRRVAPGWSAVALDDKRLIFADARGLHVHDLDSGTDRDLLPADGAHLNWLALEKQGRYLYYSRRIWPSELWMAQLERR